MWEYRSNIARLIWPIRASMVLPARQLQPFSLPVSAKYSCGTPVVLKQSAEPFSATDRASTPTMSLIVGEKQQNVALALVIPLRMKVLHELDQRAS